MTDDWLADIVRYKNGLKVYRSDDLKAENVRGTLAQVENHISSTRDSGDYHIRRVELRPAEFALPWELETATLLA